MLHNIRKRKIQEAQQKEKEKLAKQYEKEKKRKEEEKKKLEDQKRLEEEKKQQGTFYCFEIVLFIPCLELQKQIEAERKKVEKEKIERDKSPEETESVLDLDFEERRKMKFDIIENLEKRKDKNSLLDDATNQKLVNFYLLFFR
jgi:hypothetical protein